MSRFLLLFVLGLSANLLAQNTNAANHQDTEVVGFTTLEHRIVELSGLLSLSDQVKTSAQYIIAQSTVKADVAANKAANNGALVEINHAQHFGIAQSLSKRWAQAEWEQRLLLIINSFDEKSQRKIETDLSKKTLRSAQKKEKAAISNQNTAEYSLYMNKLKQRPPPVSRWKLVEALDQQSSFSALIIKTREQVYSEISSQVKGWQPPVGWQQEARQEVLEFLFYAYRKTSNPDLKKIANSYNTPALKSLLSKIKSGL